MKLQESMDKLAKLFGATTGERTYSKCYGKFSGTKDYSVLFNNGTEFFICNGYKHFREMVEDRVYIYTKFNERKQEVLGKLKEVQKVDNEHAQFMGLYEYEVVDVDFVKTGSHIGWFYITLKVNDKIIKHVTTDLNFKIKELALRHEVNFNDKNYFVAGGLDKADFIFNSVGFDTESMCYQL